MSAKVRSWLIDDNKYFVFIALLIVCIVSLSRNSIYVDTWWHLRAGQYIAEHLSVPRADLYSYTMQGANWYYPGWLYQIFLWYMYKALGYFGINLSTAVLVTITAFFVLRTMREGQGGIQAAALGLFFVLSLSNTTARAQLSSFVFTAAWYWILLEYVLQKRNLLWWLPVLMLLWVQSHGGYIEGILLLGIALVSGGIEYVAERDPAAKQLIFRSVLILVGIGLACVGTIIINPYGYWMYVYPFQTMGSSFIPHFISEWQPPDFHQVYYQIFLWAVFLGFMVLFGSGKKPRIFEVLVFCVSAYMGFVASRNIALFAILVPSVLSKYGSVVWNQLRSRRPGIFSLSPARSLNLPEKAVLGIFICALGLIIAMRRNSSNAILEDIGNDQPVSAVSFLKEHNYPGRLFNDFDWGFYCIWALPQYPVFIDPRADLYPESIFQQYYALENALPGYQEVLSRWDIRILLVPPNAPIVELLKLKGWSVRYQDQQAFVLTADGAS
jgi:hypothetical protein